MLHAIPTLPSHRHPLTSSHRYPAESVVAAAGDGKLHVLLAASGSVAAIKLPLIARKLLTQIPPDRLSIRIVLTPSATHFLAGQSTEQPTVSALGHIEGVDGVYADKDEWGPEPWRRGAPILHVELRKCELCLPSVIILLLYPSLWRSVPGIERTTETDVCALVAKKGHTSW